MEIVVALFQVNKLDCKMDQVLSMLNSLVKHQQQTGGATSTMAGEPGRDEDV